MREEREKKVMGEIDTFVEELESLRKTVKQLDKTAPLMAKARKTILDSYIAWGFTER